MSTDSLITYVSFPVPSDRVGEVARLLYSDTEEHPEAMPPEAQGGWKLATEEDLKRIYLEVEPTFRRLLVTLAGRPDPETPISTSDVSDLMGWTSPRSLPGALGAFGRRTKHRYDFAWPFHRVYDEATGIWSLHMPKDLAEAALKLHAEYQLPTTRD